MRERDPNARRASKVFLVVALTTTLVFSLSLTLLQTQPAFAAFPRTNGKITFDSNRDGDPEIFVMNSDGSGQTQLILNTATDYNPDWQPIKPTPVDGVVTPVNKLGLLATWIGLLGLIGAVTA